jgi:hypothetical protein
MLVLPSLLMTELDVHDAHDLPRHKRVVQFEHGGIQSSGVR